MERINSTTDQTDKVNIFGLVSQYRALLMGIATIFVYIFHDPIFTHTPAIDIVKNRLFIGVDIFIFLSGYGLYFTSLKKQSIKSFYIKRIERVYPSFLVVAGCVCLIQDSDFRETLTILSTIGYWWGDSFQSWYISAIILFYILFPFYLKVFNKQPYKVTILSVITGILITMPAYLIFPDLRIGFFSRIPIFSIGILFGYIAINKPMLLTKNQLITITSLLFVLGIGSTLLLNTTLKQFSAAWGPLPFIFIAPGLIILIILIFEKNKKHQALNKVIPGLIFTGNLSLEFYLIHEPVLHLMPYPEMTISIKTGYVVILGFLSLGIAFLLNKIMIKLSHFSSKHLSSEFIS